MWTLCPRTVSLLTSFGATTSRQARRFSDPNASQDCTYDWNNNYQGPDTTNPNNYNASNCAAVFFGPERPAVRPGVLPTTRSTSTETPTSAHLR